MMPKKAKEERSNLANKIAKEAENITESLRRIAEFCKIGVRMKVSH